MPEKEVTVKKEGQKIHILCPHCRGEMFIREEGTVNRCVVVDPDTGVVTTLPEPWTFQSYDEKLRIICSECDYEILANSISSLRELVLALEPRDDTQKE